MATVTASAPGTTVARPVRWLSRGAAPLSVVGAAWLTLRSFHLVPVEFGFLSVLQPSPWRTPAVIMGLVGGAAALIAATRGSGRRLAPGVTAGCAVVFIGVAIGMQFELIGSFGAVGYAFLLALAAAVWSVASAPRRLQALGAAGAGLVAGVVLVLGTVVVTHVPFQPSCGGPQANGAGGAQTRFALSDSGGFFTNDWEQISYECRDGQLVKYSNKPIWAP